MFRNYFKVFVAIVEKLRATDHVWISGTKLGAFTLKKSKWSERFWEEDIEKKEIKMWAEALETQDNPIFQDLVMFLNCFLDNDQEPENLSEKPHYRELLKTEIDAANKLANFLGNHSNDVLREGADWIPQWMADH